MALSSEFRTFIFFTVIATFVECQITSVSPKVACLGDNVDLDWVYGNTADVLSVTWRYIDSQTSAQTTIMQFAGGSATVSNNYNVLHKTNGGITLTKVTKANSGSYKISVFYGTAPTADDTVAVTVNDCSICPKDCEDRVIASIVFGIFGIIALVVVIIGILKDFSKPVCLTVAVLCIVFDIISLGLSASVLADDDCKDCKDWILNSAIAFVVIPSIVAVTAIVLTILVLLGVIGPGRNGITKKDLRPSKETVCEKLLRVLESAYPRILLVKDLIRKVDAEESVVMEQLEELKRKDLIRQLDSGGFVRHFLDVKTGITKQDLRPLEEIVCEKLLHVLESVHPNILSVKDLIRIDFAVESVVMEQLEELRRKDLIRQLDSGGFVRHFLDVQTGGMNGGRGHGGGHGPNSNTVNSGRIDKHRGTLSDRANSDGEVSRKDVHVQENRDNFSGRPMPPIPDKKGRGLSANYDDDHPMISVATPDRRAGDLGPLDEKPRKKKKKKKKAVNDNDE